MDEQLFLEQIEFRGEAVSTTPKLLWDSVTLTKCVSVWAVDTPQKNTPTCTHSYLLKTSVPSEKTTNRPFKKKSVDEFAMFAIELGPKRKAAALGSVVVDSHVNRLLSCAGVQLVKGRFQLRLPKHLSTGVWSHCHRSVSHSNSREIWRVRMNS